MKEALLKTLENSRQYTLAVAEAMPANLYIAKSQVGGWNFIELISHMGYGLRWCEENYLRDIKSEWSPSAACLTKEDAIQYLINGYDAFTNTLQGLEIDERSLQGFHASLDHLTHHRGQAVVYLRTQGIPRPDYIY